jgi:hypothetical protein
MSNKLIYLVCLVFALGVTGGAWANSLVKFDPATIETGHVYLFDNVSDSNLPDDSANSNTGNILGEPQVVDGLNGKALLLDGVDDGVHIPDASGINTSTHQNHTVIAVFNCADVSKPEAQCVYEEGGSTRGLNIYVHEGLAWAGAWNRADYEPQWNPGTFISAPIESNEWVAVAAVLRDGGPGQEDDKFEMWMDGELIGIGPGAELRSRSDDNGIGNVQAQTIFNDTIVADGGSYFEGMVDEVWILNDPLTEDQLSGMLGGTWPYVYAPDPADGSLHEATWVNLSWEPGDLAVSHDVYFSESLDDVVAGAAFAGNTTGTTFGIGALTPGATYYWQIDGVNKADPNSPYIGPVWSFSLPGLTTINPSPAEGSKFVQPDEILSWTAGINAAAHRVFLGDKLADVAVGALNVYQGTVMEPSFDPGGLAKGTTYYWRVDELEADGTTAHRGNVWSFSTIPNIPISNPNLVGWWKLDGEYYDLGHVLDHSGYDRHGTPYGDPQLVAGYGGMALEFDGVDDYVNIDGYKGINAIDGVQQPFTIANWFRIAPGASDGNVEMVTWGTSAGQQRLTWRVHQGRLRTEHASGNLRGNTYVDDDEWHHGALVVNEGANLRVPNTLIYVDGVEDSTFAGDDDTYNLTPNVDVRLGMSGPQNGRYWPGALDDVRIYNKALSADEIIETMRADLLAGWNPQPADKGTAHIWTPLMWQAGDGAVEHDVYFGTDAEAVAAADASDTTGIYLGRMAEAMYQLSLSWLTTYYWRVDEVAADGSINTGHVWSFTTTDEIVLYDEVTPFTYDNSADPFLSEISLDLDPAQDWTGGCGGGIGSIAVSYDGQAAPGSVTEADGVITVVGRGTDIWLSSDQFQYAHTTLTGDGSMVVKVESLAATDDWTKAGIMIRESLDAGSAFAAIFATGANGVRFQARTMANQDATADDAVATAEAKALTPPVWLKIERTFPMISAYYSMDGVAWTPMAWNPQVIPMTPLPIYIGLAVTSHSGESTFTEAVFSNLSSTGGVGAGALTSTEIGLESNAAEPMYMVLEDASGATSATLNPEPAATQLVGAEWIIDLDEFNIDRTAVARATLVIGDLDNPAPGGTGMLTINSVRLLPDGYTFDGDADTYGPDGPGSLDGTWDHENGSDQWDGSKIGEGNPGGIQSLVEDDVTFLRIQDPGDPRDYGKGDPGSNRKIYLGHSITNNLGPDADRILDGVIVTFRARVATGAPLNAAYPDGGAGIASWPVGGDGYVIHDGGKGNISIRQSDGDMVVSFALALASDDDELPASGLVMNKLNGPSATGDVDIQGDEPGTLNILELDPTQWHEYRIEISPDATGTGTHLVQVYLDGAATSNDFIVTAGDGNDFDDSYIAIGAGATPQSGAIDFDYVSYTCR